MKITLTNLLHAGPGGTGRGPMGPVLFAKTVKDNNMMQRVTGILRIETPGYKVNQKLEGPGVEKELTGHDTMLLVCHYNNDTHYQIWINTGTEGVPIAMWFESNALDEVYLHPIYLSRDYLKHFSIQDVRDIFNLAASTDTKPQPKSHNHEPHNHAQTVPDQRCGLPHRPTPALQGGRRK